MSTLPINLFQRPQYYLLLPLVFALMNGLAKWHTWYSAIIL